MFRPSRESEVRRVDTQEAATVIGYGGKGEMGGLSEDAKTLKTSQKYRSTISEEGDGF